MKGLFFYTIIIALISVGISCDMFSQKELRIVDVDRVEVLSESPSDPTQIGVFGHLLNAKYRLERVDFEVNEMIIQIVAWASVDDGKITTEVLIPFEYTISISGLAPGSYEVRLIGVSGTKMQTIEIL